MEPGCTACNSQLYIYTPTLNPWIFALQLLLYVVGVFIPTKVVLMADANWPAPTHDFNLVGGGNMLGLDTTQGPDKLFRDFRVKMGDLLLLIVLSEGRAGFHPNRNFVTELKSQEERQHSFLITNEVESQISEHVWPYMNHAHLQGLALLFYDPPGPVLWKLPDIVSIRVSPNGRPYGLPFLGLQGNDGSNSVPRLDGRLEDLRIPMPINMTLVGSAE